MALSSIFPATQWTLLRSLREGTAQEARLALETLCQAYWTPLYLVARSRGMNQHDAEDAVQGFFHNLLRHQNLEHADQQRGMLRNYLLTGFERYRINLWTEKKKDLSAANELNASFEAERRYQEAADADASPETLYLREWTRLILERSLDKLREEQAHKGQLERFERLAPFLIQEQEGQPLQELAAEMNLTALSCRQALFRLRRAYRHKIEEELALVLGTNDPEEIQRELQALYHAFDTP